MSIHSQGGNNMKLLRTLGSVAICALALPAQAALIDNGSGLIYDTALNITWAQPDNVKSTWDAANSWATGLTVGGVTGRMPTNGEHSSLFTALGGIRSDTRGLLSYGDPALLALFPNLQTGTFIAPDYYWASLYPPNEFGAYVITYYDGIINVDNNFVASSFRWRVFDDNVSAVPIPATTWLVGSALVGLIGLGKRKKARV